LLNSSISRYRKLNPWQKFLVWSGAALIIGLLIALLYNCFVSPESITSKYTSMGKPVQSPGYQAGDNNHVTQGRLTGKAFSGSADVGRGEKPPFSHKLFPRRAFRDSQSYEEKLIQSIVVKTRLTYELRDGAELPPDEVPFTTAGDANSYLVGPDGNVGLDFISPVGFRMQPDGRIVVINHFSLQSSSDLYGSPVKNLKNFDFLAIRFITADYGSSLEKMVSFEAFLSVNGQNILHYHIPIVDQFDSIRIHLDSVKQWVDNLNLPKNP
jgi:hypothetical protein